MRHDHVPELLPPVREARRHDRHRRDRGRGVPRDLQARRASPIPTNRADGRAQRPRRPRLQDAEREVQRRSSTRSRSEHELGQPVLVGTSSIENSEHLSRAARAPGRPRTRCSTPSSTSARREIVARRRPAGRGHDRHQHGRPRHRHQARRGRRASSAACTSSAPSATRRAASTTSCAAAPAARATPARRASSSRSRTS